MNVPTYRLHHVCIYDGEPRTNMWTWLKWYHAIPQYFWGGEEFHLTDQGHVDYTFLGCGSAFQVQLEAPPFQFEYERNWAERHGSGLNHICWIVDNAKASYDHLLASGCEPAQEYTEFGVYNGFVAKDPEGRWIEIMEYVGDFKVPDVEFRPFGIPGLQMFGVTQFTKDLASQVDWYCDVMSLRPIHGSVESGVVYLADHDNDAESRNVAMILAEPASEAELAEYDKHGALIGAIDYQAVAFDRAYPDALAAGFAEVSAPALDARIGLNTAVLREPSGNLINLREVFSPNE
jgi:catechol 2,3-dioxygenase-like lactoylglutathione lyase family enzyme